MIGPNNHTESSKHTGPFQSRAPSIGSCIPSWRSDSSILNRARSCLEPPEWTDSTEVLLCIAMADIEAGKPGGVVTVIGPGLRAAAEVGIPTYYVCPERGGREAPLYVTPSEHEDYRILRLPITEEEYNSFYALIASDLHWKLSHGLVDACAEYKLEHYTRALEVDRRCARELRRWLIAQGFSASGRGVTVSEHDFHWIRHGWELRKVCPEIQSGFQLHIPPLRYDALRRFQRRPEGSSAGNFPMSALHRGLLGHDFIACQTLTDAFALLEDLQITQHLCAPERAWLRVDQQRGVIAVSDQDSPAGSLGRERYVRVVALPVSVDVESLRQEAMDPAAQEQVAAFYAEHSLNGKRIVTSVGRCDITKNTVTIVEEWSALLDSDNRLRETSVLVVVSPTTREGIKGYDEEVRRLEDAVARVSHRHKDSRGSPTVVLVGGKGWDHKVVMAHYSRREVVAAILASNLEGMGLSGHELFVAKGALGKAVFIVSEQAGSHSFFPPKAVIGLRAPKERGVIRAAIRKALTLPDSALLESCRVGFNAVAQYTARDHHKRFLDGIVIAAERRFDRRYYQSHHVVPDEYLPKWPAYANFDGARL